MDFNTSYEKLYLSIFLSLLCVLSFAQHFELIESFQLSESEGEYGIYTSIDPTGANDIMFDMNAPNYSQNARMLLSRNKLDSFLGSLASARDYYIMWREIAQKQSVKQFTKDLPVKLLDQTMLFTSDGIWRRENGVNITARLYVDNAGKCFMVLDTDYMTSEEVVEGSVYSTGFYFSGIKVSQETTITHYCPGASLFFSSEQEINLFINKMNKVKRWKEQNVAAGKLFK